MKPVLAITMGDPAGIGPEIVVKALADPRLWKVCRPVVIGRLPIMEAAVRASGTGIEFQPVGETPPAPSPRAGSASRQRSRTPRRPA